MGCLLLAVGEIEYSMSVNKRYVNSEPRFRNYSGAMSVNRNHCAKVLEYSAACCKVIPAVLEWDLSVCMGCQTGDNCRMCRYKIQDGR